MTTFIRYPKIKNLGHKDIADLFSDPEDEIVIEIKIDGANARFMFTEDNKVIYGSRNTLLGDNSSTMGGNWKRCIDFLNETLKGKKNPLATPAIFFGEASICHSVHYDFDIMPPFHGFDIMVFNEGVPQFLSYDEKIKAFAKLNIPVVPLVKKIKAKDFKGIQDKDIPMSRWGTVQEEGVCFKNYHRQLFGKFTSTKFKEINRKTFGGSRKRASDDDERIVAMFCTNPRIDKAIFKLLIEENKELDLKLMTYLPHAVWQDIIDEHAQEILTTNWTLNIKGIRRLIGKRCISVLKQITVNHSLNKDEQ